MSAATRLGARVTVVAPDYAQATAGDDASLPFEVVRFRGGLHSMRDLPAKIMLARSKVRGNSYDVVHAADWPFFIPLALSRWRTQARVVMTVHGTEINETQTPLKRLAIRSAGVFGPRTQVVANSRYTQSLFRERFAIDARRVSAVRLGVSDFWFGPRRPRAVVRHAYRLAPDRLVIVTVARLTHRKGHHLTLAALAALPDDLRKRISWLVIGPDGEAGHVAALRRLADAADVDVRLLGALRNEDIRDIYGAADMFCLTGLPESRPGRDLAWSISRPRPAACQALPLRSAACPTPFWPARPESWFHPTSRAFRKLLPISPATRTCGRFSPAARASTRETCRGSDAPRRHMDCPARTTARSKPSR